MLWSKPSLLLAFLLQIIAARILIPVWDNGILIAIAGRTFDRLLIWLSTFSNTLVIKKNKYLACKVD